tara:strand:+ start:14 stop:1429 length:1416 start_codon:yes stop_codon:yes gene_type:complete
MAGISAGDLSRFAPALPNLPVDPSTRYDTDDPRRAAEQVLYDKALARRQAEEQRRADQLARVEMGPTPMNPLAQDRSGFKPNRRNVERVLPSDVPQLSREQQQAEAARMQAEGLSDKLIAQRQAQAMLADTSVAGRPLRETQLAEGFQSPGERRADIAGLTGAAKRQLGGGQKGLRMDTSSMTPGQRQNVVDPETGELGMRRKVRVRRGNEEGIMTMGRGRGRKGAFKGRSYEALGENPDKREFKTPEQKQIDRDRAMAERLGIDFEEPEESTLVRKPREFKEGLKPGSDAYEARHQQLENQEELLHQMYSQPVIDPETGKLVPNPRSGMAERIMQQITENPAPPTFTPRASMQGVDQFQGDRPIYRPSTGQFLGPQFDEMGQPKMTSRGAPSMTGVSPVDIEQMGRDAMVPDPNDPDKSIIDPAILSRYYDKLDAAPVTTDERRAVADRLRDTAERAIADRQANKRRIRL